jgi:hypothetical protein
MNNWDGAIIKGDQSFCVYLLNKNYLADVHLGVVTIFHYSRSLGCRDYARSFLVVGTGP